jgi:hypothetical protein
MAGVGGREIWIAVPHLSLIGEWEYFANIPVLFSVEGEIFLL